MAKANKETVHLVSSLGTGWFYSLRRKKGKAKLAVRKYDPIARQHCDFQEKKLSKVKKRGKKAVSTEAKNAESSDAQAA